MDLKELAGKVEADPIDVRLDRYRKTPDFGVSFVITENDIAAMSPQSYAWINQLISTLPVYSEDGKAKLTASVHEKSVVFSWVANGVQEAMVGDARLADHIEVDNPFRPRYRRLSIQESSHHDDIKSRAMDLLSAFRQVPTVRESAGHASDGEVHANLKLAQRHLEDAVYRAVKALTA